MAVKGNGEVPPHKHLVKIEIAHGIARRWCACFMEQGTLCRSARF